MSLLLLIILVAVHFMVATSYSSFWERKIGVNGVRMTFSTYHIPPFVSITKPPDGNSTSLEGPSISIIEWLSKKLNFTASFIILNETTSSLNVILTLISTKEVDGTTTGFVVTPERKRLVDFAFFMLMEPYTLLVPRPGMEHTTFAFLNAFQPMVWILILLATLFTIFFMTLLKMVGFQVNPDSKDKTDVLLKSKKRTLFKFATTNATYVVNTMTNQGGALSGTHFSLRLFVSIWLLAATVLVNSFSGNVISSLTAPKAIPPINSFEDLASSQDVGIILFEGSSMAQQILEADSGALKILGDQSRNKPGRRFNTVAKLVPQLMTKRYAFPYLQSFCKFFVANDYKNTGKCNFASSHSLPYHGIFSFLLQKNFKFTPMFNMALMELWETGLTEFWLKSSLPSAHKCFAKLKRKASATRPIELIEVQGVFLVLTYGLGFSLFVFVIEIIFYNCRPDSYI